ncbi:hypothetical protein BV898_06465 [Hypsibius exemplaris]|uniref:Uncharacterized protein n=1 Tax=Hypsibius exemplaris TaxID=2072580 RepID=A0A1W0WW89_HYPEX|nr:hypothetical protein BV898_06465 [Hypsibius exemplaris]
MNRRLRSGSTTYQEAAKVFDGLNMEEQEMEVIIVDNNSVDRESEEKQTYSETEMANTVVDGEHYDDHMIADIELAGRTAVRAMPTITIIRLLMSTDPDDESVEPSVPQGRMENFSFRVSVPPQLHWKRLLSDGLGCWKASKGPTNFYVRKDTVESVNGEQAMTLLSTNAAEYRRNASDENHLWFQRRAYVNASCEQYHRSVVTSADQRCPFAYMQYYFRDANPHVFEITFPTKDQRASQGYSVTAGNAPNGQKRKLTADEIGEPSNEGIDPVTSVTSSRTMRLIRPAPLQQSKPERQTTSQELATDSLNGTMVTLLGPVGQNGSVASEQVVKQSSSVLFGQFVASTLDGPAFDGWKRMEAQKEIMDVLHRIGDPTYHNS